MDLAQCMHALYCLLHSENLYEILTITDAKYPEISGDMTFRRHIYTSLHIAIAITTCPNFRRPFLATGASSYMYGSCIYIQPYCADGPT